MTAMPPVVERTLCVYSKSTDRLIREYPLEGLNLARVRRLFGRKKGDPMLESYRVGPNEVAYFQKVIKHDIDLKRYAYFLEATAPPGASELAA